MCKLTADTRKKALYLALLCLALVSYLRIDPQANRPQGA